MSLRTRFDVVAALLLVVLLCGPGTAVAGASLSVQVVLTGTTDNDANGSVTLGDKLFYTTTATNTGSVALTKVQVNNSVGVLGSNCNLAPNATCVLTNSYVVQQNDVSGGAVVNYGRATANEISGQVSDALITPVFGNTMTVIVEESFGRSFLPTQGDVLNYEVIMGNRLGATSLTNVQVSDPSLTPSAINCASVGPGGNCVLNGSYTVTAADVANGFVSQTATVTSTQVTSNSYTLLTPVFGNGPLAPTLQSKTISGAPTTKDSTRTVLSGDGTVALFESQENNLVTNNTNTNGQDIYRVVAGQTVLENIDSAGHQLIGTSSLPTVSGDGGIVAFTYSTAKAIQAKDVITGQMFAGLSGHPKHPVDTGMGGAAPNGSTSGAPSLSSAGGSHKLVFCSSASNLVPGDSNGMRDIFLVDPLNPGVATQRISTDSTGAALAGDSCEPKISADGNKVAFTLSAPSLFGTAARQIVRKDLSTGALELISVSTSGAGKGASADSSEPAINADGSVVAFTSQASDLDSLGSPVGGREAFVSLAQSSADGAARLVKRLRGGDGTVPNGSSQHPQLSCSGATAVMQTSATNLLGSAPGQCGAVAITTNFFAVSLLGSPLCTSGGGTHIANPSVSCDGSATGYDSNAPQPNTASSNSNAYLQITGNITDITGNRVANLSGDFSGQWFDPSQNGQGLVIDVTNPDAGNNRILLLTWFVFSNGQPTWVQGVGTPHAHAGTGSEANTVVVQMDQVAIFKGASFPLGQAHAAASVWGSITLTFTDANTGSMSWTSSYPGFNSGSMPIKHFLAVGLPAQDAAAAQVKSCYSGNWFNPAQSGHGFEFEILPTTPAFLAVDWFAFAPNGTPVWLQGAGAISGNSAQMHLQLIDGTGAKFPPSYNPNAITQHDWGTATFTFTDASHGSVTWNSTIAGYGSGTQPLQPLATGLMDRRGCQ